MTVRARIGSALAAAVLAIAVLTAGALITRALLAAPQASQAPASRFPHDKHATVFPVCATCHAGVAELGQPMWPDPSGCASCHDGVVKPRIVWEPRTGPRHGNRRFTHDAHSRAATAKNPADSALIRNCSSCHTVLGTPRMAVRNAVVGQCLECHGLAGPHVDVPSEACAKCHVRLTDAPSLTRDDIVRLPQPQSHSAPDFVLGGHGKLAKGSGDSSSRLAVSASCATCHARNLCIACHVNAPDSPVIRALALDDRPPPYLASPRAPASHTAGAFLRTHGRDAQRPAATCANCHARESCATCHIGVPPRAVAAMPAAGPGRAAGALLTRGRPTSHGRDFRERHGAEANTRPTTCASCHARESCTSCHIGTPPRAVAAMPAATGLVVGAQWTRVKPSSHTGAFKEQHGPEANARPMTCASCHARESCTSCHVGALPRAVAAMSPAAVGLAAGTQWTRAKPSSHTRQFREGHGPEANTRPTTCETCHMRSTCLECHRPDGGRQSRYHPQSFLTRHPSSAYARAANCTDCHNPAQFCQSCHQQAGLVAKSRIGRGGYHDAFRGFSLGHGQAARQSLESCASCHAERDCTACHSAVAGGFRFSPHGPGFNAARARSKNPSVCIACHGRVIPGG